MHMSTSDMIDLAAVIVALAVGCGSIWVAVKTLKQNQKMIEDSTRPYITVYSDFTFFQQSLFYIIIKNFGSSGAVITEFKTDEDLQDLMPEGSPKPFAYMQGAFLAPGQHYQTAINIPDAKALLDKVTFHIKYKSSTHEYVEDVTLKIKASSDQRQARASTKGQELKIISYALQDLVEKHM